MAADCQATFIPLTSIPETASRNSNQPRTRYDKRIAARREKGYREPRDRLVDQALGKAPKREPSWRQHLEGINEDNARAAYRRAYRMCRIGPRCSRSGPGQDRQDRRAE